jgi:hypothetical protein
MQMPSSDVVNAVLRHVVTSAATVATVFVTFGFISPENSQALLADIQQIVAGLKQTYGGLSNLVIILGPAVAAASAWFAGNSSTLKSLLTKVATNNNVQIDGQIVAPADVAKAVPSDKVVPQK